MYGRPAHRGDDNYLEEELRREGGRVEVVTQEEDAGEVDYQGHEGGQQDFTLEAVHLREHVQHLDEDQAGEGDAHNVNKGVVEPGYGKEHDC